MFFLFLSSLFNKFEILDYKKTVRLGRGVIGDVSKKAYEKSRIWMQGRPDGDMRVYDTYALRSDYLFCNQSKRKFLKVYTWVDMRKYSWSSDTLDGPDFFMVVGALKTRLI